MFIQCLPLEQLDWSEWAEFQEIHLIVCRPVQREIDNQKNRGNGRVAQRARMTYSRFREIIASEHGYQLVTDTGPQVKLYLESPSLPSRDLKDILDYSKPDDEVVGCLHRFRQEHENEDARLLTHDGGPMMTAKSLGLQFAPIKDEWLLPPEHNASEREVAHLKERISQLEKAEPQFQIRVVDHQEVEIDSISIDYHVYEPMSNDDIAIRIQMLRNRFPLVTDFGSREPSERENPSPEARIIGMKDVFTPATDEAIAKYTDQEYPMWIRDCQETLASLHDTLQDEAGHPFFGFAIVNDGTRPGNDTLVNIVAKGNFKICPLPREDDDESKGEGNIGLRLPKPPRPPRGRWSPVSSSSNRFTGRLPTLATFPSGILNPFSLRMDPSVMLPMRDKGPRRDPNAFYFKPNRPKTPQESFSLECEQWRHGADEEYFEGRISFNFDAEKIEGALLCEIHAENLSKPVQKVVPVKISIKRANATEHARSLTQTLLDLAE